MGKESIRGEKEWGGKKEKIIISSKTWNKSLAAHSSYPRRPERERRVRLHYITEPALILASNLGRSSEDLPKFIPPKVTLSRRKSKLSDLYVSTRGSWVCKVIVYCRSGWWCILCDPST